MVFNVQLHAALIPQADRSQRSIVATPHHSAPPSFRTVRVGRFRRT
ncbi:hypothetical protein [Dactylosporangium darangshiense]